MPETITPPQHLPSSPAPHPSPAASRVTLEEVRRVAELASMQLTAAEEPRMQHDLNAVLDYIAQLNELDTTGIPAMAQVGEMAVEAGLTSPSGETLRPDTVQPSLARASVLTSAPEADLRFFKVPKVIER